MIRLWLLCTLLLTPAMCCLCDKQVGTAETLPEVSELHRPPVLDELILRTGWENNPLRAAVCVVQEQSCFVVLLSTVILGCVAVGCNRVTTVGVPPTQANKQTASTHKSLRAEGLPWLLLH